MFFIAMIVGLVEFAPECVVWSYLTQMALSTHQKLSVKMLFLQNV